MVKVGIAGIGFMGMIHYLAYQRIKGVKVVAICEQDAARLAGDWRTIKGNFGPPGEMMDLSGIAKYSDLDEMLADSKIDMIDICLPPAAHAPVAINALRRGKDVLCEKPIALSATNARKMVATAKSAGKLLSIGHVLQFFPEYAFAVKAARGGKFGRLLGGHFKRIISDPLWLKDFYDPKKIGGPMLDLHIHDAHFIRLLFGMPNEVSSVGRMRGEVVEFFTSQFSFADERLSVTATSGVINQQGRSFTHGYEIHMERGTLLFDFAVIEDKPETNMPLTVLKKDGSIERPQLGSFDPIDAFAIELSEAVKAVRTGKSSTLLDGQLACDALILCDKQTQSVKRRRLVKV